MKILKNKLSLILLFFILIGGWFLLPVLDAYAVGDAYFPQNTTVNLTVGGTSTDFTIIAGSDADTVVAGTSNVTVTISSGQSFKMISPDRKKLTNDGSIEYTCSSAESSITLTASAQTTIVITPNSETACSSTGGGGGGGGGVSSTSTIATPTPTVVTPTPTSTPAPVSVSGFTPVSRGFVSLSAFSLKEGDVVSAAGSDDPDVYIVNAWGYKRLFLNPAIFGFYGHLGGFSKVKNTASSTRDILVTSGLFRNCETNDEKVYGVETTGEDTGMLHWVNTTGAQAVADDPEFFKKVFCINSKEFGWYKKGAAYTSVNQTPSYTRNGVVSGQPATTTLGKVKVVNAIPWLNVRDGGSLSAKIVDQVLPGQEFSFSIFINGWYKIKKDGKDFGWVFGEYVTKI